MLFFHFSINDAEYLPADELFENDNEENVYKSNSLRRTGTDPQNTSFIRRVRSGIAQSFRRKPKKSSVRRALSTKQGCSNPAFSMDDEDGGEDSCPIESLANSRKSSIKKLVKKMSPTGSQHSVKFRANRQKSYDLQEAEERQIPNGRTSEPVSRTQSGIPASRTLSAPAVSIQSDFSER